MIVRWIVTHVGLHNTCKVDDKCYGTKYEHTQHTGHESTQFLYNVHMEYLLVVLGTVPHYVTQIATETTPVVVIHHCYDHAYGQSSDPKQWPHEPTQYT